MTEQQKPELQQAQSVNESPAETGAEARKGLFKGKKPVQYEEKTFLGIKYRKKILPKRPWYVETLSWILTFVVALVIALPVRSFIFEMVRVDGTSMNDTLADGEIMWVDKTAYSSTWLSLPWQDSIGKQDARRITAGGDPARFDVVICRYPDRGDTNFVKRVVGLPGDTISVDTEGYLSVNGERYDEPYVSSQYRHGSLTPYAAFTVPRKGDVLTVSDGFVCVNGERWRWIYGGEIWGLSADGHRLELKHRGLFLDGKAINPEEAEGKEYILQSDYFFLMGDHRNNSNDSRSVGPVERSMIIGHVTRVLFPFGNGRNVLNGLDWD